MYLGDLVADASHASVSSLVIVAHKSCKGTQDLVQYMHGIHKHFVGSTVVKRTYAAHTFEHDCVFDEEVIGINMSANSGTLFRPSKIHSAQKDGVVQSTSCVLTASTENLHQIDLAKQPLRMLPAIGGSQGAQVFAARSKQPCTVPKLTSITHVMNQCHQMMVPD
jgi:hypothetical protein